MNFESSPLLHQLNDAQKEAVITQGHQSLVLAGAGSGKTRVLVHRIAWLIQQRNFSPFAILAVTFTNKAAYEMRERISEVLHFTPNGMWIGTFHGLAHRLLRLHWKEAGLEEGFQIIDSEDQLRILRRIIKNRQLDEERWPAKMAQHFINQQKDEGLRPHQIDACGNYHQGTLLAIYSDYQQLCQQKSLLDFAELLLRAYELWVQNPSLLSHYQDRFESILVDEFQDTNTIQYAWLRLLAGKKGRIMAVGDDDQSIYGWRGARVENLQQFTEDYPEAKLIRLEQNYRSTETILNTANALIANNSNRLGKKLWTQGNQGALVGLYAAYNETDEAGFICRQISKAFERGLALKDIAILYRSNAQSRVLEEGLINNQISYRIYGGLRFFERAEIKNVLAYLRLLLNPNDDSALERVINTPTRGIGDRTVQAVREQAEQEQISLQQAGRALISNKGLSGRALKALESFFDLIDDLQVQAVQLELSELVDCVINSTGLIAHYQKERTEKSRSRIENLEELVSACRQFEPEELVDAQDNKIQYQSVLSAFVDHAALESGEAQASEQSDSVQLMTLHSVKGLEFPIVFMSGVEEGLFPHKMTLDNGGDIEEERRLAYVGVTRAKEKLYISYSKNRRLYGRDTINKASRFIDEMPSQYLEILHGNQFTSRSVTPFSNHKDTCIAGTQLQLGQNVLHPSFGVGVITDYEGKGAQTRVQVNFARHSIKWLVLTYANLQTLE